MSIDDLKLKMTLVQIELAELRQIVCAKEDTFKALEWQYHERTKDGTHENATKIASEEKRIWAFNPVISSEAFMTETELAVAEKIYEISISKQNETTHDEYIAQVEKQELLEVAAADDQDYLLDPIVDIESEENDSQEVIKNAPVEDLGIEPLNVDALSIMAIKYYKKTGEAVTDIIEEQFNVKSLHKLTDAQNCALQLILRG